MFDIQLLKNAISFFLNMKM